MSSSHQYEYMRTHWRWCFASTARHHREKKYREIEDIAPLMGMDAEEYLALVETENPDMDYWLSILAAIAIQLHCSIRDLLSPSRRYAHMSKPIGKTIKARREKGYLIGSGPRAGIHEISQAQMAEFIELTEEQYIEIEEGRSRIERYAPIMMCLSEILEEPIVNFVYPESFPYMAADQRNNYEHLITLELRERNSST